MPARTAPPEQPDTRRARWGRDLWYHLLWPWLFVGTGWWLDAEMAARGAPQPFLIAAAAIALPLAALLIWAGRTRD
jgi:hypothetical protein